MFLSSDRRHAFYVVQFIERPFEGVDDYVCVPSNWLVLYYKRNEKGIVAYPADEDPSLTRDRARRRERYGDEWRVYMAYVKFKADSYMTGQSWIATRNLVEEVNMNTQRRATLNRALSNADRNRAAATNDNPRELQATNDNTQEPQAANDNPREPQATNDNPREPQATNDNPREPQATNDNPREPQATNDNPRKPTPGPAFKRPAPPNANKGHGKRSKPSETAQSSASSKPGCSKEQVIIIDDDEPITPAQARVIASNDDSRSSQSIDRNPQHLSMPAIDVDMPTSVTQSENRRTQISGGASITNQVQEPCIDESNEPISHNLRVLNSLKIFAHVMQSDREARTKVQRTQFSTGPSITNQVQEPCIDKSNKPTSHNLVNSLKISASVIQSDRGDQTKVHRTQISRSPSINNQVQEPCIDNSNKPTSHNQLKSKISVPFPQNGRQRRMHTESGMAISAEEIKEEADIDVVRPRAPTAEQPRGLVQGANSIASAAQNVPSSYRDSSSVRKVDGQRGSPILEQHITHSRQNQCLPMQQNSFERNPLRGSRESNDYEHLPNSPTIRMKIPLPRQNPPNPSIPSNQTRETKSRQNPQMRQSQPNQPLLQPQEPIVCMSNVRRISDSLRQELREGHVVQEQSSETSPSESELIESNLNVHKVCQTDDSEAAERLSRPDAVPSGPSARAGHGTAYRSSTDDQTHSRHVLDRQMLYNFAALFDQIESTFRITSRMFKDLRRSILEAARTFKN